MSKKHRIRFLGILAFLILAGAACRSGPGPDESVPLVKPGTPEYIVRIRSILQDRTLPPPERCLRAEAALRAAFEADPETARVELGRLYLDSPIRCGMPNPWGSEDEAAERAFQLFEEVTRMNPDNPEALRGLGRYFLTRDADRAKELFEKVVALSPDDTEARRLLGMASFAAGDYSQAERIFRRALEEAEKTGAEGQLRQAREFLGRIYLAQQKYELAEQYLLAAADGLDSYVREKQNYWGCPYQALGVLYAELSQPAKKAANFIKAAELESLDPYTQFDAALACYEIADLANARFYIDRALAIEKQDRFQRLREKIDLRKQYRETGDPVASAKAADAELLIETALDAMETGEFAETAALLDRLPVGSSDVRPLFLQSLLQLFQRNPKTAASLLSRAQAIAPDDLAVRIGLGHVDLINKQYEEANAKLTAALEEMPLPEPLPRSKMDCLDRYRKLLAETALLGLGWTAANQNRHEEALAYYDRILGFDPQQLLALIGKGNSLTGLRRLDEAEEVFRKALSLYPDNSYALAELALVKYNRGELNAAKQLFTDALKRDDRHYTCPYEGLGLVYLRQDNFTEAKKNFQRAIDINPDIEYKKFNGLAKIYIREGKYDHAAELLKKSIENYPYDEEAPKLLELISRKKQDQTPENPALKE